MASAQQKPKRERGTRNSARRNGKAFARPTSKGKPSFNSCLGYGVKRLKLHASSNDRSLSEEIVDLYRAHCTKRNWTLGEAEAKAHDWIDGYYKRQAQKQEARTLLIAAGLGLIDGPKATEA